ncbi:hypothetical protein AGMMS49944_15490 [Spirochaetia bacterium]|nr:hypothetical protein AGMMS49944_15490 [Spirochaetia bacterium]
MKSRFPLFALLFLAALSALPGEEAAGQNGSGLFPVNLLLDAARSDEIPWRPDWPAAMPPDAFSLIAGQARSLTLTLPAGVLDTADAEASGTGTAGDETGGEAATLEYRITRDAQGRFLEFPFFRDGTFYQAAVVYDDAVPGRIGKITLDNPAASDPWEFEFLEYKWDDPSLVRLNHGGGEASGGWYFAALEYLGRQTNETWYNPDGLPLAFFSLEYRETSNQRFAGTKRLISIADGAAITVYEYNSAGCISGISAPPLPVRSVLYTAAARPRYWERPDAHYTLQWDETGFLTRQTAVKETGAVRETGEELDIRYEYILDERLNWTERREIPLARRFGRLIPGGEVVIGRNIIYGDGNE